MKNRSTETETPEQTRLKSVVSQAKKLLTYPGIKWDDCIWDVTEYEKPQAYAKRRLLLPFTEPREHQRSSHYNQASFEQPFADFAKAIIRTRASERGMSFSGHTHMIVTFRYLYKALRQTGTADPTKLTRKFFSIAMTSARARTKGWTHYHVGKSLAEIARWIDERELTRAEINFSNPIPYPGLGDGLDPESQARGLGKLPSAAVLDALADISSNPANDTECILIRIIDLLVICGFRIGEALCLPLDCWVPTPAIDDLGRVKTNPLNGEPLMRYGIRYSPEKGGDPHIKWLSDIAVPLAQRAVTDLTRLCGDARKAAESLERNPDRVPLPGVQAGDELLDHQRLKQVLGLKSVQNVNSFLKGLAVKPVTKHRPNGRFAFIYRAGDIEKALLKRSKPTLVVRLPGGQSQRLSESLCVMFRYQFASRSTLRFLPELISVWPVRDALGNSKTPSVFSVRGLTQPGGARLKINTHAFRHWLNTLLSRGGLSDVELARWSGRRNIDQNAAYKHGTVEQRITWAREMIREGTLRGPAADTYHSISDLVEKEEFLETFVNVALFTPYGVCIHDYAIDPCPYHLNCLGGCSEYLRTKGDMDEQKSINDVRSFHLVQLQRVKKQTPTVTGSIKNYEAHCERIVEGAEAALAVDNQDISDGQLVKVFPTGKPRGRAITSL